MSKRPAWKTDCAAGDRFSVGGARAAAVSGYPSNAVPATLGGGLPIGASFAGVPQGEAALLAIAEVFERARGPFPEPTFAPTLP